MMNAVNEMNVVNIKELGAIRRFRGGNAGEALVSYVLERRGNEEAA